MSVTLSSESDGPAIRAEGEWFCEGMAYTGSMREVRGGGDEGRE